MPYIQTLQDFQKWAKASEYCFEDWLDSNCSTFYAYSGNLFPNQCADFKNLTSDLVSRLDYNNPILLNQSIAKLTTDITTNIQAELLQSCSDWLFNNTAGMVNNITLDSCQEEAMRAREVISACIHNLTYVKTAPEEASDLDRILVPVLSTIYLLIVACLAYISIRATCCNKISRSFNATPFRSSSSDSVEVEAEADPSNIPPLLHSQQAIEIALTSHPLASSSMPQQELANNSTLRVSFDI